MLQEIQPQQLTDYYIFKALADATLTTRHEQANWVWGQLTDPSPSIGAIADRISKVVRGKCEFTPASTFAGNATPRWHKDKDYAGLWTLVDMWLPDKEDRWYVGLPANQLHTVCQKAHKVMATERDASLYKQMSQFIQRLLFVNSLLMAQVLHGDIWDAIAIQCENYNIFDLDLMCHLPQDDDRLNDWARALFFSALKGYNIIHLTAVVGRNNTDKQHTLARDRLIELLQEQGFKLIGAPCHFNYVDCIAPMRSTKMVLRK